MDLRAVDDGVLTTDSEKEEAQVFSDAEEPRPLMAEEEEELEDELEEDGEKEEEDDDDDEEDALIFNAWMQRYRGGERQKKIGEEEEEEEEEGQAEGGRPASRISLEPPPTTRTRSDRRASLPCPVRQTISCLSLQALI